MKNIFSKTTENRTQNGVKSYSFPILFAGVVWLRRRKKVIGGKE